MLQIFNPTFANSLFTNQSYLTANGGIGFPLTVLPFTSPVQSNFKYAYAERGNLTIERELAKDMRVSFAYNYTHGVHLHHTISLPEPDSSRETGLSSCGNPADPR